MRSPCRLLAKAMGSGARFPCRLGGACAGGREHTGREGCGGGVAVDQVVGAGPEHEATIVGDAPVLHNHHCIHSSASTVTDDCLHLLLLHFIITQS